MDCYLLLRIGSNTFFLWVYFRLAERKGIEVNELIFFLVSFISRYPGDGHSWGFVDSALGDA
ncbi:MAG: hypothetical protein CMP26_03660 [Roseibacillus sp.]|jgi:hypothetical protein|nr:hypothetical protein [Roseibacillus sp.]|tara:strand:+ start:430 stop:615 length:186 start_codon:yes stop_codon:yes gene_type:complete